MPIYRVLFATLLLASLSQSVFAEISIQAKAILQGAYDPGNSLMRDDLRNKSLLPTEQPYGNPPFNYAGNETLTAELLDSDGGTAIVDWVLLDIYVAGNTNEPAARKAALLQRNGLIVDSQTGSTQLTFPDIKADVYQVAVRHRNHLTTLSQAIELSQATTSLDFTQTETSDTTRYVSQNKAMLWAGNTDTNNQIVASGPDNDSNTLFTRVLTDSENASQIANFTLRGYDATDLNMDGSTLFAGPGNDINLLQANVLLHPGNTATSLNYIVTTASESTIGITPPEAVEQALASGSVKKVSSAELLDATLETITDNQNLLFDAKTQLFNLNTDGAARNDGSSLTNIDWNPTHDATMLLSTYGMNTPVLVTNSAADGYTTYEKEIGIIGEDTSRYMVLGGNPMRNYRRDDTSLNEQMHQFLENSLSWLTTRNDLKSTPSNVVIAHMNDSYYFPDERAVREWLDQRYPGQVSYNAADTCDDIALAACLDIAPDLLIISQHMHDESDTDTIADTVKVAMSQGIPVLYMHLDGGITELGRTLFSQFNVSYQWDNYWKKLKLSAFDPTQSIQAVPAEISQIQTMLNHFDAEDYAFDWDSCDGENCSEITGLETEFQQGADAVRSMMTALDTAKLNIFEEKGFRLQKLLALLGDSYRQQTSFPMDKIQTSDTDLLKAYFADHAVYNYRSINPVQTDMGNFSRSDFSHITPVSKTIELESKVSFRSAGVYALPGETVRVTRLDNSDVGVKIFVNTQRSGSTHQWAENGYSRPKFLKSPQMAIKSGGSINFTSPYGGPLQVAFDANDLAVELHFENIGEHAHWASSTDDSDFTDKLTAGDYDWAELVTPGFEVHSTLDKMRESVTNWESPANLAEKTMRHLHNLPHVLAGFQGPGISVVSEVHDFAAQHGLTIETLEKVKHMNADQATCGYGCSGNPYDAYWAFSPTGHGDIHELGHGLEKSRFRFSGWEGHSTTNPYSYYSKSQYYKETGHEPDCQNLPFESVFNTLKNSINEDDPTGYLQSYLWQFSNWSQQVTMTIQMMMAAQHQEALIDGWLLLARLHILEREFNGAKANETNWEAMKGGLGFSTYTLAEAKALTNNDWMMVSVSHATGLDYRNYIRLWGQDFSAKAEAQVADFAYPPAERRFFVSSPDGYCKGEGFDGTNVLIDGTQDWPLD
uniref:Peptidase M60 domain-containing protein n=1 Tax=uncultured Thiotrichaceae bacterium TaxID=298394 RepID=A0A6S6SLJ6_9GAMM|nr:MAG: FIG01200241: hypothetical protein [uncultured Thiotrichaceae bacterium]